MKLIVFAISVVAAAQPTSPPNGEVGSKACASCHPGIYKSYAATGMSRSSGKTGAGAFRESFKHGSFEAFAVRYRASPAPQGYRLEFSRAASDVKGERILEWFVGSGNVGRSYLFSSDGFLFQAPVSYYTQEAKWDLSPGYQRTRGIELTRAVETACLQCHASRLQPVAGTQNGFGAPPFLEGGISCERCHGPGRNHIAKMSTGARDGSREIVNPAKLDAARRDSICAQCHLTGAARIGRGRAGKGKTYRPGELLSDYSTVFVWTDGGSAMLTATSHYEKLQRSGCKQGSGDRLWCGSCHNPHSKPPEENRVAYFRTRCLNCHELTACKADRLSRQNASDDCTTCHMPKSPVRDVEHAVYTDHAIPKRVTRAASVAADERSLVSFWNTPHDERDLGVAYAAVAGADPGLGEKARALLESAALRDPDDLIVASQLAQIYDRLGEEEKAMALADRVVRGDPSRVAVAVNLGTYWIKRGRVEEAMRLWQNALARNPGLTSARVNLAVAQFRAGERSAAEASLVKALHYDPDQALARRLLTEFRGRR